MFPCFTVYNWRNTDRNRDGTYGARQGNSISFLIRNVNDLFSARPVGRPLVQEILKLMYEPILGWNLTSARPAKRSLLTSRLSIVTWKRTTSKLLNVRLLVTGVEKPFSTAPLSTLMYAPLINNPPLPLTGNDPPLKTQAHLLPKNRRSPLILVRHQLHRKP